MQSLQWVCGTIPFVTTHLPSHSLSLAGKWPPIQIVWRRGTSLPATGFGLQIFMICQDLDQESSTLQMVPFFKGCFDNQQLLVQDVIFYLRLREWVFVNERHTEADHWEQQAGKQLPLLWSLKHLRLSGGVWVDQDRGYDELLFQVIKDSLCFWVPWKPGSPLQQGCKRSGQGRELWDKSSIKISKIQEELDSMDILQSHPICDSHHLVSPISSPEGKCTSKEFKSVPIKLAFFWLGI